MVREINITEVKPSEYNPRMISNEEYNKLKESIDKFGLTDPIIINLKNNTIIGGHQRYSVIKNEFKDMKLYMFEIGNIGWITSSLEFNIDNFDDEILLNINLNSQNGEWDLKKLKSLVEELEMNDFDTSLTGFDEYELETFDGIEDLDLITESIDEIEIEKESEDIDNILVTEKEIIYTLMFNTEEEYKIWNDFLKLNVENLSICDYIIKELGKYV